MYLYKALIVVQTIEIINSSDVYICIKGLYNTDTSLESIISIVFLGFMGDILKKYQLLNNL